MILVDTSIWIDHLRKSDDKLKHLLAQNRILSHPFVVGELAMGNLRKRELVLGAMRDLPQSAVAEHEEVLHFVSTRKLSGLGIGYVDAHLLAAVQLTPGASLWTRDKQLAGVAAQYSLAYNQA